MKRIFLTAILLFFIFLFSGCSTISNTKIAINNEIFNAGDKIVLNWNSVEDAESYKVCIYIYPLNDDKLARSIELTDLTWEGDMPMGKYDVVVYAKKKKTFSDASNTITFTVASQSIPNWDDISYIFSSTNDQTKNKYGTPTVESDLESAVIETYDDPSLVLTYDTANAGKCSQIDIYDTRFILLGLTLGESTQSDLISALTQNNITYEDMSKTEKFIRFTYNNYDFIAYMNSKNLISYITIKLPE